MHYPDQRSTTQQVPSVEVANVESCGFTITFRTFRMLNTDFAAWPAIQKGELSYKTLTLKRPNILKRLLAVQAPTTFSAILSKRLMPLPTKTSDEATPQECRNWMGFSQRHRHMASATVPALCINSLVDSHSARTRPPSHTSPAPQHCPSS